MLFNVMPRPVFPRNDLGRSVHILRGGSFYVSLFKQCLDFIVWFNCHEIDLCTGTCCRIILPVVSVGRSAISVQCTPHLPLLWCSAHHAYLCVWKSVQRQQAWLCADHGLTTGWPRASVWDSAATPHWCLLCIVSTFRVITLYFWVLWFLPLLTRQTSLSVDV